MILHFLLTVSAARVLGLCFFVWLQVADQKIVLVLCTRSGLDNLEEHEVIVECFAALGVDESTDAITENPRLEYVDKQATTHLHPIQEAGVYRVTHTKDPREPWYGCNHNINCELIQ